MNVFWALTLCVIRYLCYEEMHQGISQNKIITQ